MFEIIKNSLGHYQNSTEMMKTSGNTGKIKKGIEKKFPIPNHEIPNTTVKWVPVTSTIYFGFTNKIR